MSFDKWLASPLTLDQPAKPRKGARSAAAIKTPEQVAIEAASDAAYEKGYDEGYEEGWRAARAAILESLRDEWTGN